MVILGCVKFFWDRNPHKKWVVHNDDPVYLLRLDEHISLDQMGERMKKIYCVGCRYYVSIYGSCIAPHETWRSQSDTEARFASEVNADNNCRKFKQKINRGDE